MKQREFVELLQILVKTVLMDCSTASTAVLLAVPRERAHALRAMQDTVELVVRSQTLAALLPTLQRMALTAISTVLTEALWGGPRVHACALLVTPGILVTIVRLPTYA